MKNRRARIEIEDNEIVVAGAPELHSRHGRRFFQSVLGGRHFDDGWRVPRRGRRMQDLIVRINNFLETEGFDISHGELAAKGIELALERRRSLERAGAEAISWKAGHSTINNERVSAELEGFGWRSERRLHPHQLRNVCHALAAVNQANFSVPGAGKTVTALATGLLQLNAGTIDALLVVGPLACFEPWETETAAAVGTLFRPRRGSRIYSPSPGNLCRCCPRGPAPAELCHGCLRSPSHLGFVRATQRNAGRRRVAQNQAFPRWGMGTRPDRNRRASACKDDPDRNSNAK